MIYAISDLHGCCKTYLAALREIGFQDRDTLYVVGDVIDRGKGSMQLLLDMMSRPNVIPLRGNHEHMALTVLKKLCVEITAENAENHLTAEDLMAYSHWINDGGGETITSFRRLSREEQGDILDYLEEFSLYEAVTEGGRDYVLVHGGMEPFVPGKPLSAYREEELLFRSPDYSRVYFPDLYLITGHTPTVKWGEEYRGKILQKNNHIAIDCGCVYGLGLGVYCLTTGECIYIPSQE